MEKDLSRAELLKKAKRWPNALLFSAIALFLLSLTPITFYPVGLPLEWLHFAAILLRAIAEAAMVGALADWFAVTALFRRVNIPVLGRYTEVIPRNQAKIAKNISDFIKTHFLSAEAITGLFKEKDPAKILSNWLLEEENSERFGMHSANILSRAIKELHDESVKELITKTLRGAFKDIDLSRKTGEILELIVSGGKHNELLDQAISNLTEILKDPGTRARIASGIAKFIRDEYPNGQILVPTEAIGGLAARKLVEVIERCLKDISQQPNHDIREAFNNKIKVLIIHLKGSSEFAAKGGEIKEYILNDEKFVSTIRSAWDAIRNSMEKDLRDANSEIRRKFVATGNWIGKTLEADQDLRSSFNRQVESLVKEFTPSMAKFASEHIEGEINKWKPAEMSALIEESLGPELQNIRINGTIIGGILGAIMFFIIRIAEVITNYSS